MRTRFFNGWLGDIATYLFYCRVVLQEVAPDLVLELRWHGRDDLLHERGIDDLVDQIVAPRAKSMRL